MIAVDSSVVVAAFASWHERHEAARQALDSGPQVVGHAVAESYSVLMALPSLRTVDPGRERLRCLSRED